MTALVSVPVLAPLVGAAVSILVGRWRNAQRLIGLITLTVVVAVAVALLVRVDRDGVVAVQAGGWEAPIGITLVADRLAAIMLVIAAVMLLAVLVYAVGQPGAEADHVGFHPTYLILATGIGLSFLTGDLFNLFVAFEVMLMASYVLLTLGGRPDQVRSGMTYVVISLVASTLFLVALAVIYASTGTVNLADLHGRLGELPDGLRTAIAVLLVVVFGIKSALFPLCFWLPDSYPTAPSPVTAVFAGLLTKVGVYALIRSQTLLVPVDDRLGTLLLIVAGATMVVGVLGAISQDDVKRILSFHIISQIGYMVMGLGLFSVAGLAGAVLYIVHHIVVKTTLFLVAGLIEQRTGTGQLSRLSGLVRLEPLLAVLFMLPALSLAGVPPFSGFVAKLALVEAGIDGRAWLIVGTSLLVSILTLFSMTKIWANGFWGDPDVPASTGPLPGRGGRALMVGSTVALVALGVAVSVAAGPVYALAERAATDLVDVRVYVEGVLGP